jgi:hypothetical protein
VFGLWALVVRFDALPVLGGLLLVGACLLTLVRPQLATLAVIFLLYVNFPAILTQRHGVPDWVAGSFILLLAVPLVDVVIARRESLRSDATFYLMVVFVAALLLSSFRAVDQTLALSYVMGYVLEGVLLYWLILNAIRNLSTLRRAIWTILAAGAFLSALCVYQDVTGSYTQEFGGLAARRYDADQDLISQMSPDSDKRQKWDRAEGPVGDPNRFAQIMLVLLPLAVVAYRAARSLTSRVCAVSCGWLILAGVLVTLSRGAFLTLVLMGGAMLLLKWVRPGRALTVGIAILLAAPAVTPFFLTRLESITNAGYLLSGDASKIQEADSAIRGRTTEMLAALHVFLDHPILGVGPGQFSKFYFQDYGGNADIKFRDIQRSRRAHTLYLEMAAETGMVGLIVFLAIVGLVLRKLWLARRQWQFRRSEYYELATAFWFSLFAYLCTAIFLHLSYQRYYWILVAMACVTLRVINSRHQQAPLRVLR